VVDNVSLGARTQLFVSVSAPGRALIYRESPRTTAEGVALVLFDRKGRKLATLSPSSEPAWGHLELSPDDTQLLGDRVDRATHSSDLWVLNLTRNIATRITFDPGSEGPGIWSPDGKSVFFRSMESQPSGAVYSIMTAAADGSGKTSMLVKTPLHHLHVSPNGKQIAFENSLRGANEISLISVDHPDKVERLIGGSSRKAWPQFSPDGGWMAYASDESGRSEIYVQSYPPGRGKWQVSRSGGDMARWRRDGKELVFNQEGRFYAAEVRARNGGLEFGAPVLLFEASLSDRAGNSYFAISSDAQRFAFHQAPAEAAESAAAERVQQPFIVLLDWMAELKR
jgi:Tol biopolymer transport system component